MSLHALQDGKTYDIRSVDDEGPLYATARTHVSPKEYARLLAFAESCVAPRWDVSLKSALAQVSVDIHVHNRKPLEHLKYRAGKKGELGQLSIPMTIALESAYARQNLRGLVQKELDGADIGRLYVYDAASALHVDDVQDLYDLPAGYRVLDDTTIGLPMDDVHYAIKENVYPNEVLYYATHGRQYLHHVLQAHRGALPHLETDDTLISAFTIDGKTDILPPTNIVLGIQTTRRGVEHLRALLLDQGRIDAHHKSAGDHKCSFQVELVNRTGHRLDQEEVKETLVTAKFYRTENNDGLLMHDQSIIEAAA